jgi:hypothetical protein
MSVAADQDYTGVIYTERQTNVLRHLYYVTPPLSLLGSALVIYVILRRGKSMRNVNNTFLRLMMGYSAMDVVQSIVWLSLGPWATPENNPYVGGDAAGSVTTCNIKGFFTNLTFGLMLYSASIACYHAMKVNFEFPDFFISKGFEPAMHGLSWFWPTFVGLPSLWYNNVNPYNILPGVCWVVDYPSQCVEYAEKVCRDNAEGDVCRIQCTRGNQQAANVRRVFGFTTFLTTFVLTTGAFILLFRKAKQIERRLARYGHGTSNVSLSKKTGRQGMRYSVAFVLCNISWPFLVFGRASYESGVGTYYFPIAMYTFLMTPLQGFMNAILFLESQRSVFARGGPLHSLVVFRSQITSTVSSMTRHSSTHPPNESTGVVPPSPIAAVTDDVE